MIAPDRISLSDSFGISPQGLVDQLLAEQQDLTAVERFSAHHAGAAPDQERWYRDLLPLREPGPGEQYAFEVDLDRCTGCKACVTACHSLNGLDEDETWRSVGLLQKVQKAQPAWTVPEKSAQQHVTTACHHCLEPGCAQGCPTLAYEKDPATGIVKHLDDQCFGCQYCVLKCPYDVPQYNAKRGIVRKCDLCIGRLRAGEAPACAQACPTKAISVTLVETAVVRRDPGAAFDLPGVPDPARVKPTTRYVSKRGLSRNLIAADASQVRPEHAHLPLTFMLVASQAAAGYWVLTTIASLSTALTAGAPAPLSSFPFPWMELLGVAGVQFALALSLLHLGRPWLAWKAFLGWRRSWLSREVIAFTALSGATGLSLAAAGWEWQGRVSLPPPLRIGIMVLVLLSAWAAVYASAMVYRDTPRLLWAARATLWRFVLTALLCGIPAWLLAAQVIGAVFGGASVEAPSRALFLLLPLPQLFKLLLESSVLKHRDDEDANPLWKAAQLLLGRFRPLRAARLVLGLAGGIVIPGALAANLLPGSLPVWTALMLVLITAGELIERYFFFTTAVAPRMPGARS
jgi:formate dehydrogenase iron-sulfur subunit